MTDLTTLTASELRRLEKILPDFLKALEDVMSADALTWIMKVALSRAVSDPDARRAAMIALTEQLKANACYRPEIHRCLSASTCKSAQVDCYVYIDDYNRVFNPGFNVHLTRTATLSDLYIRTMLDLIGIELLEKHEKLAHVWIHYFRGVLRSIFETFRSALSEALIFVDIPLSRFDGRLPEILVRAVMAAKWTELMSNALGPGSGDSPNTNLRCTFANVAKNMCPDSSLKKIRAIWSTITSGSIKQFSEDTKFVSQLNCDSKLIPGMIVSQVLLCAVVVGSGACEPDRLEKKDLIDEGVAFCGLLRVAAIEVAKQIAIEPAMVKEECFPTLSRINRCLSILGKPEIFWNIATTSQISASDRKVILEALVAVHSQMVKDDLCSTEETIGLSTGEKSWPNILTTLGIHDEVCTGADSAQIKSCLIGD